MSIDDTVRATVAANLADFLLKMEAKVELDSDPVSIEAFTEGGQPVGGVAIIRGIEPMREFIEWATDRGLITPGKDIVDGKSSGEPTP